jgi:hypothetical protein
LRVEIITSARKRNAEKNEMSTFTEDKIGLKRATLIILAAMAALSGCVVAEPRPARVVVVEHDQGWHERCDHPHDHDDYCYH